MQNLVYKKIPVLGGKPQLFIKKKKLKQSR